MAAEEFCGIDSGIGVDCSKLRNVGGNNRRLWIANLQNENGNIEFTEDASGYLNTVSFPDYEGLYQFVGPKKGHSGGYTAVIQSGGNKFFQHDVIVKLLPGTPAEDVVIEDLLVSDVVVFMETNNSQVIVYGADNGMEMSAGVQNTGSEAASDTADTLTFVGEEKKKPRRFLVSGGFQATIDYLDALVIN